MVGACLDTSPRDVLSDPGFACRYPGLVFCKWSERKGDLPGKRHKHVPLRSCIACHNKRPKRELIRIVRTPEGAIEIDLKGKRSGRGAYLCPSRQCWEAALQEKKLGRALKCQVTAEDVARLRAWAASSLEDAADDVGPRPAGEQVRQVGSGTAAKGGMV